MSLRSERYVHTRLAAVLVVLLVAAISASGVRRPTWAVEAETPSVSVGFASDWRAGSYDATGEFMSGTETLRLIGHDGKLFAGLGVWMDVPYLEDKPSGPWTGAQVLVKDSRDAPWRLDVAFGRTYGRTESLAEVTFTTDTVGTPLEPPVTLLVAGPSDWNPVGQRWAEAWTRDDETGRWTASRVVAEPGSAGVRSFGHHVDQVTGIHHIFAGISRGEIYRGSYDPAVPSRLGWSAAPELEGTGRVMAFAEANGVLYAAAGVDKPVPDGPAAGGLYKRIDGPDPRWELVYQWPYTPLEQGDEANIMRGLTAVPDPTGSGHQVLLATRANPGVVERIDPATNHSVAVELDIREYFAGTFGVDPYRGPSLSAYNRLTPATDPYSGQPLHLLSLWVEHPQNRRPPYNGSWFLIRHSDATYTHEQVHDPAHPVPAGQRLRATRTIVVSPFAEDEGRALYFGGYDCARAESHNTAWVYRGVFRDPSQPTNTPVPRPSRTVAATPGPSPTPRTAPDGSPNIVFVLTDDQDLTMDSLSVMPHVRELVAEEGTSLADYYLSYPLCCPSRSTILRGQYVHSHRVYTNLPPVGGYEKWMPLGLESSTVGTWLQQAGYRTVYIGKYLNGYPLPVDPLHVPPGWTEWYSPVDSTAYGSYNYRMNENGSLVRYGSDPEDHITDVVAGHAVDAVRRVAADPRPFFLHVATYAPHAPADPAPRHGALYPNARVPRVPSFNETDVSDKPSYIQRHDSLTAAEIAALDASYRKRLQSLQAVDEMVAGLVQALEETHELDNTFIVFTSDNGFHMGHHRLPAGKSTAYEEDIHVPLVVRGPGVPTGRTVTGYLAGNVDLAPTFADLAGVTPPDFVEGRSLASLLGDDLPTQSEWRQAFLVEGYGGGSRDNRGTPAAPLADRAGVAAPAHRRGTAPLAHPYGEVGVWEPPDPFDLSVEPAQVSPRRERELYVALRTLRYTFIESKVTDEFELYDNLADPYQLENLAQRIPQSVLDVFSARANSLHACRGADCRALESAPLQIPTFTPGTPAAPPTATPSVHGATLYLPLTLQSGDSGNLPTPQTTVPTVPPTAIPGTINGCSPERLDRCTYRPVSWFGASSIRALEGYTVANTAESREIPVLVRVSVPVTVARPVIVWSHGGGPRDEPALRMNREWATTLARAGYVVVQPAHISPDRPALCEKLGVTDPDACRSLDAMTWYRPTDARAVLDALPEIAAAHRQIEGLLDTGRVAYAGHSYGAFTTMTIAGTRVDYVEGHMDVSWSHPLPRAFMAMSPQGPGRFGFHDDSWRDVTRPVLTASGAGDAQAGGTADDRREPFRRMPPGDKYELWIDSTDAVHATFNLSGLGPGARYTQPIAMTGLAFLDAYVLDHEPAKTWLESTNVRVLTENAAEWSQK